MPSEEHGRRWISVYGQARVWRRILEMTGTIDGGWWNGLPGGPVNRAGVDGGTARLGRYSRQWAACSRV